MSIEVVATFPIDMLSQTYMQVDTYCRPTYKQTGWFRKKQVPIEMNFTEVNKILFDSMKKNAYIKPSEANWKCENGYMLPFIGFMLNKDGVGIVPVYSIDSTLKTITFYDEYKTPFSNFMDDVNAVLHGHTPRHAINQPSIALSRRGGTRRSKRTRRV
jgi:hypothetical protein